MYSNSHDILTFRYRPFADGGVAEFFAAHGVDLHDVFTDQLQRLRFSLEQQMLRDSGGDFWCDINDMRFVFEGPDEMGALHYYLCGVLSCSNADY